MSSMLASMLRRAAAQPKPPALGAIATNLQRNFARGSTKVKDNFVYGEGIRPKGNSKTFKDAWLADKGAWPVLGVIGFAVVFCSGFLARTTFFHPDVRIDRKSRATTIRSPGDGKDD